MASVNPQITDLLATAQNQATDYQDDSMSVSKMLEREVRVEDGSIVTEALASIERSMWIMKKQAAEDAEEG